RFAAKTRAPRPPGSKQQPRKGNCHATTLSEIYRRARRCPDPKQGIVRQRDARLPKLRRWIDRRGEQPHMAGYFLNPGDLDLDGLTDRKPGCFLGGNLRRNIEIAVGDDAEKRVAPGRSR